jgi:two-component system, chemotaxis family, sensor kinase CheA
MLLLDRLSIRTKLTLLAGIPVFGALLLSVMVIHGAREGARAAEAIGSIEDLAELSDRMRDLATSLQAERARTAWATGRRQSVEEAAKDARGQTDLSLVRLLDFITARDQSKLPPRLARDLGQARQQLAGLRAFRAELAKGEVSLDRQLDFYSEPTVSLVGATAALTELSNDGGLLRNITSLASAMEVKERQSLEHALLAYVFAHKEFPPGTFRRLVMLNTEEQLYEASLTRSASEAHRRVFERAFTSPASKAAADMIHGALNSADDDLSANDTRWFEAQESLVNDLGEVEKTLGTQVRQAAKSKLDEAHRAVRVGVGLTVAVLLVSLLLALLVARGVARSIRLLAAAAEKVRGEQDFSVRVKRITSDEVGRLTDAFNDMLAGLQARDRELAAHREDLERLVAERTQELSRRNDAMRLVLDNVAQGLATASPDGTLSAERSAAFDRWFGTPPPHVPFGRHIAGEDLRMGEMMRVAFEQVLDELLPLEVSLEMMPKRLERDGRIFAFEYAPLLQDDKLYGLLLMVSDVTNQVHAEQVEAEQREQAKTFHRVLSDRVGFVEFFADARTLVAKIRDDAFVDGAERRRVIHTLKGNASLFDIETVVTAAHQLEQSFDDGGAETVAQCRAVLVDAWDTFAARTVPLLGEDLGDRIELTRAELDSLLTVVHRGANPEELEHRIAQLAFEPMRVRLSRIGAQLRGLARRLGKAEPQVVIRDNGVRLPPTRLAPLWGSFSHIVRNIVDHGFDSPETRLMSGKPAQMKVELVARETPLEVTLVISDDGRGIDWERVREKALQQGLPNTTRNDLVEALQSAGFSTAEAVTTTSGRGVGLAAVSSAVHALGGKLTIESEKGRGTRFTISLSPLQLLADTASPRLSARPLSNRPHPRPSYLPPSMSGSTDGGE